MLGARQGKEVVLSTKNRIGLLAELSKQISEKGVSILSVVGAVTEDECLIRLITDDNLRTVETLRKQGYEASEEDVILLEVPHKPGMLKRITEVLAKERLDTVLIYATALQAHDECLVVIHTTNDEHAIPKLNELGRNLSS